MEERILISFIIPVYKVEYYIDKCLNSICSQFDVFKEECEIIVVNDGTPDNSMSIVKKYAEKYEQIRIIEQENRGLSEARNAGLNAAIGEYVWFIDSDDWLLDNSLKRLKEIFRNNNNVDVFASVLEFVYEDTNFHETEYHPKFGLLTGKEYLKRHYYQGASPRFILKKDFLSRYNLNFYPNILHEDGLFGYIMLYFAHNVLVIDKPLYAYLRRNKESIMTSISIKSAYDLLFIYKKLQNFANRSVIREDKKWFRECIFHVIECIFVFSESIWQTSEFKQFYSKNRDYIKKESFILLKRPRTFIKGIFFLCKPQYWFNFRNFILRIKKI